MRRGHGRGTDGGAVRARGGRGAKRRHNKETVTMIGDTRTGHNVGVEGHPRCWQVAVVGAASGAAAPRGRIPSGQGVLNHCDSGRATDADRGESGEGAVVPSLRPPHHRNCSVARYCHNVVQPIGPGDCSCPKTWRLHEGGQQWCSSSDGGAQQSVGAAAVGAALCRWQHSMTCM